MKVLHIESHPDFDNADRSANKLAKAGYDKILKSGVMEDDVIRLNLYDPENLELRLTHKTLTGQESEELQAVRAKHLADFIEADHVYIYMPVHNFNINSGLKDYFDTILIANQTFKYTENGPVGLLSDEDKKVTFVLTSGSEFTKDYSDTSLDHTPRLMSSILGMMGLKEMKLIRAEGLDIITNDKALIVDEAIKELEAHITESFA